MAAASISLPQASVNKVINLKLQPGGLHMSKDAKEAISEAASIFILYLASTCVPNARAARPVAAAAGARS